MTTAKPKMPKSYEEVLAKILRRRKLDPKEFCDRTNEVESRILTEYGAIFIADDVLPPPVCMFTSDEQVAAYQRKAGVAAAEIGGVTIELQPAALEALLKARRDARRENLDITPRDGAIAGRRNFADTLRLWNSRFVPAADYWLKEGRLTVEQIENLQSLPLKEQVKAVLNLEKDGIYFNTFFDNSILYSVAAPGTSQHLAMLAFDATEFENPRVREILARHGWFRTVQNDTPHFTYLGRSEKNLAKHGLKKIETEAGEFWIPNTKESEKGKLNS